MNNDSLYNNIMIKIIKTILILLLLLPVISIAQVIDLKSAIEISLDRNDKIRQYTEKLNQKEKEDKSSIGNFLPNINLTASYNHLNDDMNIDLDPIRQAIIKIQSGNQVEFSNIYNIMQTGVPLTSQQRAALLNSYTNGLNNQLPLFVEQFKKQDNWYTTLTGVQPIFYGGKLIAAKKYSNLEKEFAEIELEKVKKETINEVINNYLNVILVSDVIQTRKDVLAGMYKHRDDAKRLYEGGVIAKNQYLRSEVAVADADRDLFDEQNKLDLAIIALKNTIGLKENEQVLINDTLVFKQIYDSVLVFKEKAYTDQPLIKMLKIKKDETEQKYNIDRSEFLPKIAFYGKYEIIDSYLSQLEPKWAIGIQGSLNIFNGFKSYLQLQTTKHMSKEVDYLEADTKSKISLWVDKAYKDMLNSKNKYFKLENNIALADENLRLTSGRFQTGLGTSLDVIDAELTLEKNQIDRKISIYEYYKSLNDLYLASGNPKEFLLIWNNKEK